MAANTVVSNLIEKYETREGRKVEGGAGGGRENEEDVKRAVSCPSCTICYSEATIPLPIHSSKVFFDSLIEVGARGKQK